MRRWLFLLLLLACAAPALWAQTRYTSHRLLRVYVESRARLTELRGYTQLDLAPGLTATEPYLVARSEDLDFLRLHGYRYDVLQENLEQFYASRLQTSLDVMGGYRTYSEINATLDSIHTAHPTISTAKFSIGQTGQGREMWVMKISDNPTVDEDEPEVFYNALIHAREPVTMEGLLYFMHYLTDNYGTNPDVTALVNSREMYFLPCVNPDGYVYNQTTNPDGGGLWRKNRNGNGIDLNRNFGLTWGLDNSGSSPISTDETYRGPSAFSELETQHLRDFINARQFVTEMDYHTYSNLVLYPWSTSYYDGDGLTVDNATFNMLADSCVYFCHSVNNVWYTPGTPWQTLYNTNGGSFDWEYGEQTTKPKIYAMSIEVGSNSDGFWPAANRILPLAQEMLPTNLFLARIAGQLAPRPYAAAIDGHCEVEWNGNANSVVEPGEGFSLTITLRNTGTQALTGVHGILSSADPYFQINASAADWPNLASGGSAVNSASLLATVDAACPASRIAPLALHVTSTNGLDTTLYLDAAVGSIGLADNAEGGAGDWTSSGSNNEWHLSTRRSQSPTHSWFCGNETGSYVSNMNCSLVSDTLIVSPGANLSFDEWYSLEADWDYGYVEVNTGTGWEPLTGAPAVTGASGTWVHIIASLPVTCAGTALRVRFRMTSDELGVDEGWYLDNINTTCPGPANISVNPASLTLAAMPGGSDSGTLQVCNTGLCPLTWNLSFYQVNPITVGMHSGASALDEFGGPDSYGYRWRDSNAPGGPAYAWAEIATIGSRINFTQDNQTASVTLPWSFPFYGNIYSTLRVSTNGNVHFGTASTTWTNPPIPATASPNSVIAPFWDDLSPQLSGGAVYTYFDTAADRFIIQYDSVAHNATGGTGRYTFEAILYHSGRILFQYQSLVGTVDSCTVGIENQTGATGLQVVYNSPYLSAPLAIELWVQPIWLTISPSASTVLPGACQDVLVTAAAGTLPIGTYTGQLALHSNDPDAPMQTIPVSFAVGTVIPPESFVISYNSDTQSLRLGWAANGAPNYKVYAAATPDGPFTTLVGTTTTSTLTIPLPAEDLRFFVVVAAD
jgi:carboxypeptidase T